MKILRSPLFALGALAFLFMPVTAQAPPDDPPAPDCGTGCTSCFIGGLMEEALYPPTDDADETLYNMSCELVCLQCGKSVKDLICEALPWFCRVSDIAASAEQIIEAISTSSGDELKAAANTYRDRLVLDAKRHLLGIRGMECGANSITTVIFLSEETTLKLQDFGVASLELFLSATTPTT